jgi:hypothetical protein
VPDQAREFQNLLETPSLPDLGPGPRPGIAPIAELSKKLDQILAAWKLPSRNQELIRALVLLWHDHLDAAHKIAQDIEGPDGAFVHGIMHRREPDFGNAAYWFRRVGAHPAFLEIFKRVTSLDGAKSNAKVESSLLSGRGWDPFAFIHLCEEYLSSSGDPTRSLLQEIQAAETSVLLEHFGAAV